MNKADFLVAIFFIISYLFTSGRTMSPDLIRDVSESETEIVSDSELNYNSLSDSISSDTLYDAEFTELEDIIILENKKLIESDGAKLSYNVSEDPEAGNSNVLDILRKIPGVTVDAEDNVKVNGKSSFKILKDGREDPMLKGDLKSILKSLPAATIRKIEVISEPGAKFDAEGTGGILNIVTDRKSDLTGLMSMIQSWINSYQAGGNVNLKTKINKVMLDALVTYNNGNIYPRNIVSKRETYYLGEAEGQKEILNRNYKSGWDYTGTRISMSWEPDTLNLLTFAANYGFNSWGGPQHDFRAMIDKNETVVWNLSRDVDNYGKYNGIGTQISYQHTFGKLGHNIVASYEYDFYKMNYFTDYNLLSYTGLINEKPFSRTQSKNNDNQHLFQIDYSNPFTGHHGFETGAKINLNRSTSESASLFGINKSNATADPSLSMNLIQFKDIFAIYGSYSGNLDKWNIKAGVRYESTNMGLRYNTKGYKDFTTRLNDLVPNIAISYNTASASNLRLAYQTRISRPSLQYLNPYVNNLTPGWITYGNPNLKSEFSNIVSFSYSNFEGKFGGMAKVSYQYVANGINDVVFEKNGLINSTYENIGRYEELTLDLNASWKLSYDLTWNLFSSISYEDMSAKSDRLNARNHGWSINLNSDVSYKMPHNIRLNAYGGFNSPWIDLQSRGSTNYYYGLGANRSFLKEDALTISLSIANFCEEYRKNRYIQKSETINLTQTTRYKPWNIGLSISWKFGGLKTDVKKTSAVIEKEISSGSSNRNNK